MRGIVLEPLFRLRSTVSEVGRGNLDTEATVRSRDELGELAGSINAMIAGLKLEIALLKRDKYGRSAERSAKLLDQLELQLGELVDLAHIAHRVGHPLEDLATRLRLEIEGDRALVAALAEPHR